MKRRNVGSEKNRPLYFFESKKNEEDAAEKLLSNVSSEAPWSTSIA